MPLHKVRLAPLCVLLLLLCVASVGAGAKQLARVRTFTIHDGIPSNYVSQIAQDDRGVIWLATWGGIALYDGYRFVAYRDRERRLASSRIYSIYPGDDDIVWLLTYDMRPFYLDTRSATYVDVSEMAGRQLTARRIDTRGDVAWIIGDSACVRISGAGGRQPECTEVNRKVKRVVIDRDGREWMYMPESIALFGSDTEIQGKFSHSVSVGSHVYHVSHGAAIYRDTVSTPVAKIPGINGVTQVLEFCTKLVISTRQGLFAFDTDKGLVTAVDRSLSGSNIYTDSQGRLWAIDDNRRVYIMDRWDDCMRPVEYAPVSGPTTLTGHNLCFTDPNGVVWVGPADRPLAYYDEQSLQLVAYPVISRMLNNTAVPRIDVTFVDRQNNLWASSMHNLNLINFCGRGLREVPLKDDTETRSVARAADGSIWMGTTDGTLGRYSADGIPAGYLYITADGGLGVSDSPRKFADRIYALMLDSKQNMWIGTKGQGIYIVASDGSIEHHLPDGSADGLPCDNIYDFDEDLSGNIWIATYGCGVALVCAADNLHGGRRFVGSDRMNGYPAGSFSRIRRITHTPSGVMLAASTDGLLTFDSRFASPSAMSFYTTVHDTDDQASISSSHLMHVMATSDGAVYVAPLGESIQRADADNLLRNQIPFKTIDEGGYIHPFLSATSAAGNVISMVEGRNGMVYIVLESCILAYSPTAGNVTTIGYNDYDSMIEFTESTALYDSTTGFVWAPSARGAFIIDPGMISISSFNPNILVTSSAGNDPGRQCVVGDRLVLAAGTRNVSLWFSALDYSGNELIQYAYSLDGDDHLTYIGNTNSLNLTGLDPGRHSLKLVSTNGDGAWVGNETEIEIYVTPTFWESNLGRAIIILLVIALIGAVAYGVYMWRRHPVANLVARRKIKQQSLFDQISTNVSPADDTATADDTASDAAPLSRADRELLGQLTAYIERHLADEDLRVENIADAMHLSRTVFYSKIKTLVGMSPSDFIRRLRMDRARNLITDSDLTFSEIAYAVGFSDPKYFTKCFKRETGMTPKDYRRIKPEANTAMPLK